MTSPIARALFGCVVLALSACGDTPPGPAGRSPAAQSSTTSPAASQPMPETPATPAGSAVPAAFADDIEAIRSAGAAKDAAYTAANANGIAAVFENDAVLMPPAAPVAEGRLAIRKFLAGDLTEMGASGYKTRIPADSEITLSGDYAFRSGTYSTTDETGAVVDTGKWLEVWHKADGQWRIGKSIWNSDSLPLLPVGADEE